MKNYKEMTKAELIKELETIESSEEILDELKRTNYELEVHQIELEMQNRELQESRKELELSHHKYTDLFDFAPTGYFIHNASGVIDEINITGAKLLGFERKFLVNTPFRIYVAHSDIENFQEHLLKCKKFDKEITTEIRLKRNKDEFFYAKLITVPVQNKEGILYRTAIIDITEAKRVERLELFKGLMAQSNDAVFLIDPRSSRFIEVNEMACSSLGYNRNELLSMGVIDIEAILPGVFSWEAHIEKVRETQSMLVDGVHKRKDGSSFPVEVNVKLVWYGNQEYMVSIARDITERKRASDRQEMIIMLLKLLNSHGERLNVLENLLRIIKDYTGFEAVGIRLREGEDFPYYATEGFPPDFLIKENYLCARDKSGEIIRNLEGNPSLECMCGNILSGRTNPALPFFTEGGSFWTNSTSKLLASTIEKDRQALTRNRCNSEGYESVALIPIYTDNKIVGLLQLNDRRPDMFTPEMISFFEGFGSSIGIAVKRCLNEDTLRESEEHFRAIFEHANDGILLADISSKKFVMANEVMCNMLGYSREELLELEVHSIHPPEELKEVLNTFQRQAEGEILVAHNLPVMRKDRSVFYSDITSSSVRIGKQFYLVGIFRDITERKEAEEERERLQAQKMEAIGTMAAGVAHNFNNILGGILGATELAIEDVPEGSQPWLNLKLVIRACNRAADIVKEILTFSRQSMFEKKPVDVGLTIENTVKLLKNILPENIEIKVNKEATSSNILANKSQIQQIILNLCNNSAHAIGENKGVVEINLCDIHFTQENINTYKDLKPVPHLKITVSDNGCGIEKENLDRIFEPFFTTKHMAESTGLGLSTVHGIVKRYGGEIEVNSEVGKGTTFEILFPVVEIDITPKNEYILRPVSSGTKKVLFVDDEKTLVEIGKQALEKRGYEVFATVSSIEALEIFKRSPDEFDIAVIDMGMPEMSGKELIKELISIRPDIPVILCSGYHDILSPDEARVIGIKEFLEKPVGIKKLAETIEMILRAK